MLRTSLIRRCPVVVMLAIVGLIAPAAADEGHEHHGQHGDLVLFPAIQGIHLDKAVAGRPQNELQPEIDIFFSTEHERLRFLAEFLVRKDEQEMERMQLGWLLHPAASLWLGRFHSPLGFWNSQHHHGAFMQTTISRPSILAYEDESGVLPTHILGALVEGSFATERGELNHAFGFGRGPVLEDTLEPVDILNPHGKGKLTLSGRLSYRAESAGEFGAFAGHTRIPVLGSRAVDEVRQWVAGGFYNFETERLRFVGELFRVDNQLEGSVGSNRKTFSALYLQPEYRISQDWTAFGRIEATSDTRNDPYLNLHPEFVTSRYIGGSRFSLGRSQALKFELSHNERQDHAHFNQVSLQWSMVYP